MKSAIDSSETSKVAINTGIAFRNSNNHLRRMARRMMNPGNRSCVCGKTISTNKSLCGACVVEAFKQRQRVDYWAPQESD